MKKIVICFLMLFFMLASVGCKWMYDAQYNKKGVSHFLVITVEENQPKEYVGTLDGYKIFVERLNLDDTYFISVTAEYIFIKDAIENKLVSINEWRKYAWKTKKVEGAEILQFENYEIVIIQDECTIRPYIQQN